MADDLYMFLKCRTASGLPEELVPEAEEINDLWYGAAGSRHTQSDMYTYETVEVKNSVVTARRIELIRNTNLLKVTLSGLEHLTPEVRDTPAANRDTDFKLWAVATDERYKSDNTFDGYTRSVRYSPFKTSMDANTLSADIKVLRLTMDRPVLLYIETPGDAGFRNSRLTSSVCCSRHATPTRERISTNRRAISTGYTNIRWKYASALT